MGGGHTLLGPDADFYTDTVGWLGGHMGGGSDTDVKETPVQKEQAAIASQQWEDYQQRWQPVQDYFISRTENTAPLRTRAEGMTNAAVQNQFGNAQSQVDQSLAAAGINAGSGRQIGALAGLSNRKGTSLASGLTNTDEAIDQQYVQGLGNIISMGRGQTATMNQGLGTLADESGQQAAADAERSAQAAAGLGSAIGTGVGFAGSYIKGKAGNFGG